MIRYVDDKTRVRLKFHPPAIGYALVLQEKIGGKWRSVNHVSILDIAGCSFQYALKKLRAKPKKLTEKQIGMKILETDRDGKNNK